jgi:hypothetical protein
MSSTKKAAGHSSPECCSLEEAAAAAAVAMAAAVVAVEGVEDAEVSGAAVAEVSAAAAASALEVAAVVDVQDAAWAGGASTAWAALGAAVYLGEVAATAKRSVPGTLYSQSGQEVGWTAGITCTLIATTSLMVHAVSFLVAELGPDVGPFILHLLAALAEKERAMIGTCTKARGVKLGGPKLAKRARWPWRPLVQRRTPRGQCSAGRSSVRSERQAVPRCGRLRTGSMRERVVRAVNDLASYALADFPEELCKSNFKWTL